VTKVIPEADVALGQEGEKATKEVSGALLEELRIPSGGLELSVQQIWRSRYAHAKRTAEIFCEVVADYNEVLGDHNENESFAQVKEKDILNPDQFWSADRERQTTQVIEALLSELERLSSTGRAAINQAVPAILVIGHEPQLGWIAERLLRNILPVRHTLPIMQSELACIAVDSFRASRLSGWKRRLIWVISPAEKAAAGSSTIDTLREKIKSKMETAKLLGGVIIAAR
jgi:phosphohistidine phosphatase SixA